MYHEPEFYKHSKLLRTMARIKRLYLSSHLRHYVERYILRCDVCQAAELRNTSALRTLQPLLVPDTKWHNV